ncbi:MAG: monovalent cation/H+ antiporter subunit D family protein [Thermodesulfobacteriota bacterium]
MMIHFPALLVVVPLVFSFLIFAFGLFDRRVCFPLLLAVLAACLLFAAGTFWTVLATGQPIHYHMGAWNPPWGIEYVVDHLNGFLLVAIAIVSLLAAIYAKTMIEREIPLAKHAPFYALYLLQVTGLFGMTVTGDMFNLYVLLEIASFSAYAIIGMGEGAAAFAAFRYMIFGTLGACAYLLGVGYLYLITGSLNMADLRQLLVPLYQSQALFVGFAFLLVGIGVKMAIFPVHVWLPDSYTLAPSSVSVLLAPLFTKVGAYVLIRVLFTVFEPSFSTIILPATQVLGWVAVLGIVFSSIMALAQTDLKRMLCYLIVTEIGYIMIGVASGNRSGLTGSIFHIANDMFMMALLFMTVGAIQAHFGTRKIAELTGLHRKMPVTAALLVIGGLSVIGVPPLCGFFSKWYLMLGVIQAKQWTFMGTLLLGSLLNAILFFRIFEKSYFEPHHDAPHRGREAGTRLERAAIGEIVPMVLMAAFVILLGLFSGYIVRYSISYAIPKGM